MTRVSDLFIKILISLWKSPSQDPKLQQVLKQVPGIVLSPDFICTILLIRCLFHLYKTVLRETQRCTAMAHLLLFMSIADCQSHILYVLTSSPGWNSGGGQVLLKYKCHCLVCKCQRFDHVVQKKTDEM